MEREATGGKFPGEVSFDFDTTVAHPARVYDYWLGGKDNFAADREAAEQVLAATPGVRQRVRGEPRLPGRAVRYLAGRGGHQPVPRHRHRASRGEQHARGRAAVAPDARSCTSTTTRSCSRTPARC